VAYALGKVRRTTDAFFVWWFDQLKSMLPERLKLLLVPDVAELILELSGSRLLVRRRDRTAVTRLGAVEINEADPEAAKGALRTLLQGQHLDRMRISLRLPSERALRKVVDLPAAAEENLRQVLTFEMDRLTPFPADAVHFDVRVLDHDDETKRLRAELMILPRSVVDPSVATLRRLGLDPEAVALSRGSDDDAALAPWRVPLASDGPGTRRLVSRPALALFVLAAVLVAASVWLAFQRERDLVERLDREVAAARKDAEEGRVLQEEIERLTSEGTFIVDKKRDRPAAIQVLAALTRSLSDDNWLYRMRFTDQELQIFGYSPNASALIGTIENSPLFSNAQFRAPLTRDQRVEAEQFHIAFRVQRENNP
jgi:general secretion pathway protein L